MSHPALLFAQLDRLNPLNPTAPVGKTTGLLFKDVMMIIATGLVLAIGLLLWARYRTRKRKRRHHHHERSAEPAALAADALDDAEDGVESSSDRRRRKRRRRRRDHRSRNPTLAETGGLPPAKPEDPAPSV